MQTRKAKYRTTRAPRSPDLKISAMEHVGLRTQNLNHRNLSPLRRSDLIYRGPYRFFEMNEAATATAA